MSSTTFKEVAKEGSGVYSGNYVWSLAANWTNGVPVTGSDVGETAAGTGTDADVDDIANLTLNSLNLAAAGANQFLEVAQNLTIGALVLTKSGANIATLVSNSTFDGTSVVVSINASLAGQGTLLALGSAASIFVNAADPGNMTYETESGGLVFLAGTPAASSTFSWLLNQGVFAFANPGATIGAAFVGAQSDAAIELPVTQVFSVTYGSNSIAVATNEGVYNLTNVSFSGLTLNDFATSVDFTTGLEKITFLSAALLQTNSVATSGAYDGYYQWSKAANWTFDTIPSSGSDVSLSPTASGDFVDDEATTAVNRLTFPSGGSTGGTLTVNGVLTIGSLQLGGSGADILEASTLFSAGGATTATLTVNNMVSASGGGARGQYTIEAFGAGASVEVSGADPGAEYNAYDGGKVFLNVDPTNRNTSVFAELGGTIVFLSLGTSVNGVTTLGMTMGIATGASIELPGTMLISNMSNDGHNPEAIVTDYGTYVFSDWYGAFGGYDFGITDFIATRDVSTNMLKLTAEAAGAADNPQHNHDVLGDGFADIVFQNVSGETAVWDMNGAALSNAALLPNPGGTWAVVGTGDFTGDGKSDFLLQDASGAIAEWLMNGNSVASGSYLPDPGSSWKVGATGDFNGDGMSDIALQGSDGSVAIWEMNGANIIPNGAAVVANPGVAWTPITSGDFWGDGKSELVLQNTNGSLAFWGFNDSASGPTLDPTHTSLLSLNPGAGWVLKGTGDFNDDGMSDLVFQNLSFNQVAIWEMNQTGLLNASSYTTLASPGANWVVAQIGDFNDDGMSDILFQNTVTGQLDMWTMHGLSLFASGTLAANPGTAWHVISG